MIVLTLDEEATIGTCLARLERFEDVVIVDSGSSDATIASARSTRPEVRIFNHAFEDFGQQRNWALDHTDPACEWILFVDADEYCDPELIDEVLEFVQDPGDIVGGYIAGRNHFLGRWLKHSTMYPSYQLRLLKHGAVRYRKEGHGQREVTDGQLTYLHHGWYHDAFSKGVHQWVARHNQYSTDETELIQRLRAESINLRGLIARDAIRRRRSWKRVAAKMPFRPLSRFVYTYFVRRGFLDGWAGLRYCLLRVAHDIHLGVKLAEKRYLKDPNANH